MPNGSGDTEKNKIPGVPPESNKEPVKSTLPESLSEQHIKDAFNELTITIIRGNFAYKDVRIRYSAALSKIVENRIFDENHEFKPTINSTSSPADLKAAADELTGYFPSNTEPPILKEFSTLSENGAKINFINELRENIKTAANNHVEKFENAQDAIDKRVAAATERKAIADAAMQWAKTNCQSISQEHLKPRLFESLIAIGAQLKNKLPPEEFIEVNHMYKINLFDFDDAKAKFTPINEHSNLGQLEAALENLTTCFSLQYERAINKEFDALKTNLEKFDYIQLFKKNLLAVRNASGLRVAFNIGYNNIYNPQTIHKGFTPRKPTEGAKLVHGRPLPKDKVQKSTAMQWEKIRRPRGKKKKKGKRKRKIRPLQRTLAVMSLIISMLRNMFR